VGGRGLLWQDSTGGIADEHLPSSLIRLVMIIDKKEKNKTLKKVAAGYRYQPNRTHSKTDIQLEWSNKNKQ
jgi:hypothetical protein